MLKNQRKDTYQSPSQSSQKMAVDDPLLKVPLAKRGNLQERGGRYFTLQVETPMSL